jgi:hypothetical protein
VNEGSRTTSMPPRGWLSGRRLLTPLAVSLLALAVLVSIAAAPAAAFPRMTSADRRAISTLIDRFVKDVVLRQNLADGWTLAGPDLRGGTTRKTWVAGTGVTVAAFPARGTDFRNAWTGHLVSPTDAELSVILLPKPGSGDEQVASGVDVRKIRGRWIVNLFYTAAVFRTGNGRHGSCGLSNCAVSGPNDFGANGGGAAGGSQARIGSDLLWIVLALVGGIVLVTPAGIWISLKRRDRRAWAKYSQVE